MKKLIFCLAIFFALGSTAFAQDTLVKYWYYPKTNVYYNQNTHNYSYYDEPVGTWLVNKALPSGTTMNDDKDRYEVDYKGPDVWKENKAHRIKYKVRKNGTVKMKPADNN